MLDLEPATRTVTRLLAGIRDDQLADPTPCDGTSLAAMLDHVDGFATAFACAARKKVPEGGSRPPVADASRLAADWRTRIPQRLSALADAWREEAAWTGMTSAGGVELPGDVAGMFALDEILVHGWDIAAASRQDVDYDAELVRATYEFVRASVERSPQGTPGLFGPPVPVSGEARLLDRLVGLTGRDPDLSLPRRA